MCIASKVCADAKELGVRESGALMVHSSLRSLGAGPNSAAAVVQGLRDALGPDGTLLMPALSYENVSGDHLLFDVRQTPTCVGALTEFFRTMPGVERSLHPTHSVCALGARQEEALKDHGKDHTPVGPNSPFSWLRRAGGQILMLGCSLNTNTSFHGIEECVDPDYLFGPDTEYRLIDSSGAETSKTYRTHGFKNTVQRYERIIETAPKNEVWRKGRIMNADSTLFEAASMWDCALKILQNDPDFFVRKTA